MKPAFIFLIEVIIRLLLSMDTTNGGSADHRCAMRIFIAGLCSSSRAPLLRLASFLSDSDTHGRS